MACGRSTSPRSTVLMVHLTRADGGSPWPTKADPSAALGLVVGGRHPICGRSSTQDRGYDLPRTRLTLGIWVNKLLLGALVKELLLGRGLGGLLLIPRFRRDSPHDHQQLWEQASKKQQKNQHALHCAVLDL